MSAQEGLLRLWTDGVYSVFVNVLKCFASTPKNHHFAPKYGNIKKEDSLSTHFDAIVWKCRKDALSLRRVKSWTGDRRPGESPRPTTLTNPKIVIVIFDQLLNMRPKTKKRIRTFACTLFVLIVVYIVWSPLSLTKISDRSNPYVPDQKLKSEIKEETTGMTAAEIRSYSVRKTAKLLSFTIKNDLSKGEANCIGYAQMCASISNYAFMQNGINASAKPVVGYVMFYGINLCDVLKWCMPNKRWENFVKDHDFVEYHIDGQTIYCDASAYDLLYKDCKTTLK